MATPIMTVIKIFSTALIGVTDLAFDLCFNQPWSYFSDKIGRLYYHTIIKTLQQSQLFNHPVVLPIRVCENVFVNNPLANIYRINGILSYIVLSPRRIKILEQAHIIAMEKCNGFIRTTSTNT